MLSVRLRCPVPKLLWATLFCGTFCGAPGQQPAASGATVGEAQLSPGAAYDDALQPLEATRRNVANWSDVEIAAMKVAIANAKAACDARTPVRFTGNELVDFARLCSLGQEWSLVSEAATRYIAAPGVPKPRLTEAYALQIEADLRLKAEPAAITDSEHMLSQVAYTPEVADSIEETLTFLRFVYTADALTLASARQPLLLQALRASRQAAVEDASSVPPAAAAASNSAASGSVRPMPASQLYAEGLEMAGLQQLMGQAEAAEGTVRALDSALPQHGTPDDTIRIAQQRRRYALLGKPLRGVTPLAFLQKLPGKLPELPAVHSITAFLLFPDWCAQCVRLGPALPETVFTVEGHGAYLYALLAQTVPPRTPPANTPTLAFDPAFATAMLTGTATLTVSPGTLDRFVANDFPFLILTDGNGVVRVLEPVGNEDLAPGGAVDAAIARVGKTFPVLLPNSSQEHGASAAGRS